MSWSQPKPRQSAFGQTPRGGSGGTGQFGASPFGGGPATGGPRGQRPRRRHPGAAPNSPWQQSGGWGTGGQGPGGRGPFGQSGQPPFGQPGQPPPGRPPPGQPPPGQPPPGQPPFGGPPGPGPGGYPSPQPPRRGLGPFGKAFLIGGPIAVAIVVVIGIALFGGGGDEVATPPPRPIPSTTPTSAPSTSAEPTPSEETSTEATATYEPPTLDASTDGPKRSGPYKNFPQLTDNKLYGVKLGRWSCAANPTAPNGKAFEGWIEKVVDCMMGRFGPVVAKQTGEKLPRPKIIYYSGTIDTPCGRLDDRVPYYCGSPQSRAIYVNPVTIRRYDDGIRLGALQIIFHEFAHHVQYQFGLLTAGFNAGVEDQLQASRRVELQAECISWSQTTQLSKPAFGARDSEQMWRWVSMGQDAKHGKASSHQYWYKRIEGKGNLGLCNTWVAAKKHVR